MAQFKDYTITNAGMALVRSVLEKNTTLTLNVARLSDDPSLLTMDETAIRNLNVLPVITHSIDFVTRSSVTTDGQIEIDSVITNADVKQDYQFTAVGLIYQQTGQADVLFAVAPGINSATLNAFNGSNPYNLDLTIKVAIDSVKPTITFSDTGYLTAADGKQMLNTAKVFAQSEDKNKVIDNGDGSVEAAGKNYRLVDRSQTVIDNEDGSIQVHNHNLIPQKEILGDFANIRQYGDVPDLIADIQKNGVNTLFPGSLGSVRFNNVKIDGINASTYIDCHVLNEQNGWLYIDGYTNAVAPVDNYHVHSFVNGTNGAFSGWRYDVQAKDVVNANLIFDSDKMTTWGSDAILDDAHTRWPVSSSDADPIHSHKVVMVPSGNVAVCPPLMRVAPGQILTLSLMAKTVFSSNADYFTTEVYALDFENNKTLIYGGNFANFKAVNQWDTYSLTFTVPNNNFKGITFRMSGSYVEGGTLYYADLKLEKGSISTPYVSGPATPAQLVSIEEFNKLSLLEKNTGLYYIAQ